MFQAAGNGINTLRKMMVRPFLRLCTGLKTGFTKICSLFLTAMTLLTKLNAGD
jgi:hypothetical protein